MFEIDKLGDACSPRTRGWSPPGRVLLEGLGLLPAHAGMVPRTTTLR
ncbi:hypothetical protein F750_7143 (plasmid) [Streptomyces sp. PAMC 26508]|nr:hypothetical protein F750_7143 [Streptomyces sp. PAMC 26508]